MSAEVKKESGMNQSGKMTIKLLIWPSILISIIATVLLNLLFHFL